jgi:hypothetical protein
MQLATDNVLSFFQLRLRTPRPRTLTALLPWCKPRSLRRRFAMKLEPGRQESIPLQNREVVLRCASGSLWITHDGDCKDVTLEAQQSYRPDRDGAMCLHALQPCVLEVEFEDDADT